MKLGTGNRWDEMAAMATMLVFSATLIALGLMSCGGRAYEPAGVQPAPVATQTSTPAATANAALPISTPVPLPYFDVVERSQITAPSSSNEVIARPVSFSSGPEQNLPPPLCVHWKIYGYDAGTNSSNLISEFYETCGEDVTTSLDLLPESLVRAENTALRDQLSFLVRQFTWEEYFELSHQYAQLKMARVMAVLAEHQTSP